MAAQISLGILPVANLYGPNNAPIWHGIEASSQTYKQGTPLINSSGSLATAATLPTLGTVVGISCAKATGVTGADIPFYPILNGSIWEITARRTVIDHRYWHRLSSRSRISGTSSTSRSIRSESISI